MQGITKNIDSENIYSACVLVIARFYCWILLSYCVGIVPKYWRAWDPSFKYL